VTLEALARRPGARGGSCCARASAEEGRRFADTDDHVIGRVGVDRCRQRIRLAAARGPVNPARPTAHPGAALGL
jgi:hypothetical protein